MKLPLFLLAPLLLLASGFVHAAAPATGLASTPAVLGLIPETRLPPAAVQASIDTFKHEPLSFAVAAPLQLDARNGSWDSPKAGLSRWRLRIGSEGATTLSLLLTGLALPAGAELWFYGTDGRDVQGPFTARDASAHKGLLQLPLVRSEAAVLEVLLPEAARDAFTVKVTSAYHGYRNPFTSQAKSGVDSRAVSGSCNIDVVCTEGNNWRDAIRATALITVTSGANQLFCTATLVNNTRQDDRALMLTANHCRITGDNVSTVTAYFNMQSDTCGVNNDGRVDQNRAGGTFLARDSNSDFTLFTLASPPAAAFNVYYAGWDARSDVAPQSGVTIHHPSGDEKKISVYSTAGRKVDDQTIGTGSQSFTVDSWEVTWSRGTTEGGSSGSPLWNQAKQVVGVLSGGAASCSAQTAPDYFGRLDCAWTANAASSGQLMAHLDPIGTNCLQLASKNPGSATPVASCAATSSSRSCNSSSGGGGGSVSTPVSNNGGGGGAAGLLLLAGLAAGFSARRLRGARARG